MAIARQVSSRSSPRSSEIERSRRASQSATTTAGTSVTILVAANDNDPNGDALTVTGIATASPNGSASPVTTGANANRLRSEVAINSSAGLEHDFGRSTTVRVESYYKRFSHLLVGQLETDADRLARLARYDFPASLQWSLPTAPIITSVPTNDGAGRAYGFDLFVTRTSVPSSARVRGWASYAWGHANREIGRAHV